MPTTDCDHATNAGQLLRADVSSLADDPMDRPFKSVDRIELCRLLPANADDTEVVAPFGKRNAFEIRSRTLTEIVAAP